jgi:hypothetical protein
MRKSAIIILLFVAANLSAQNPIESRLIETNYSCDDVSLNASRLFENFIALEQFDSARFVVNYWEGKCGLCEVVQRAKILLALKTRSYSDTLLGANIISSVVIFKNRMEGWQNDGFQAYDYGLLK